MDDLMDFLGIEEVSGPHVDEWRVLRMALLGNMTPKQAAHMYRVMAEQFDECAGLESPLTAHFNGLAAAAEQMGKVEEQ